MQPHMMDWPLTLPMLLERARAVFPGREIVSRLEDGSLHRMDYAALHRRVLRLMGVLHELGVRPGDRVATFAWNSYRHLELYFAIPCLGAVLHTINVRLAPAQARAIVAHAQDRWIFVDAGLVEALAPVLEGLGRSPGVIVLDDEHAGSGRLAGARDYETLMEVATPLERMPTLDEQQPAGLCYTSGTTGEPKGVLYSHRAYVLHSFGGGMVDSMAVSQRETVMPVVPMFHANAWGFPFTSTFTGAKQVLPGPHLGGADLADLIERERVTLAAGVPTVWSLVLESQRRTPRDLTSLRDLIVGGSAVPLGLLRAWRREQGVTITQAWGMTETTPVGCCTRLREETLALPEEEQLAARAQQGLPVPGLEVRIVGEDGEARPHDGESVGELCVRGPWVVGRYFAGNGAAAAADDASFWHDAQGGRWFRTGDVASVDELGYVRITDRMRDLVKSRGEWISSVAMENAACGCAGVHEAAVTGRADALRGEAPVLWYTVADDAQREPGAHDLVAHLARDFPRWQLPRLADVHRLAAIPKTSVGKIDKRALRRRLVERTEPATGTPV